MAQLFSVTVIRIQQLTQEGIIETVDTEYGKKYEMIPTILHFVKNQSEKLKNKGGYNIGVVTGYFCVGSIIGRKTLGDNNIPSNCFYLKGSAKIVNSLYKDADKPNSYGTEYTKSQIKSKMLTRNLNKWVKTHSANAYRLWINPATNVNSGYPDLKSLQK